MYIGQLRAHGDNFWRAVFSPTDNIFFRPVFCAVNLLSMAVLPLDPFVHHVRNWLFSALDLLLLYRILLRLVEQPGRPRGLRSRPSLPYPKSTSPRSGTSTSTTRSSAWRCCWRRCSAFCGSRPGAERATRAWAAVLFPIGLYQGLRPGRGRGRWGAGRLPSAGAGQLADVVALVGPRAGAAARHGRRLLCVAVHRRRVSARE